MESGLGQFKKIAFLSPRPGMGLAAFYEYWRGIHGPTVANAPGYAAWRVRYAQNHVVGDGPVGGRFPYPGAAIFDLPGDGSNEAAYSASATYRDHVRVDELNFVDMERTIAFAARAHVVMAGTGPVKLLVVGAKKAGMERAAFDAHVLAACEAACEAGGGLRALALGWEVNLVVPGSLTLPGARPVEGMAVDCVIEIWFAGEKELLAACGEAAAPLRALGREVFAAEGLFAFQAREHVFFDRGRVVARPGM